MTPKKHILILDDDVDMNNLISKVLNNVGHITHYVTNADDFYEQLDIITPHLIFIDNNLALGQKSGISIVQRLKKNPILKKIPIILISSSLSKKLLIIAVALGVEELITKPIQINILLQKVNKCLTSNELANIEFQELKNVTCEVGVDIAQISESTLRTLGPIKFHEDTELNIKSAFLDKLGCQACRYKTNPFHVAVKAGEHLNEIAMKGVKEETARKIRLIKVTTNKFVKIEDKDERKVSLLDKKEYVLALDDDEDFNNLLKVIFKRKGIKIITTTTSESFIQQLKIKRPTLCLVDINLEQGQDAGYSLLEALRKKYGVTIPIIILSRRRDNSDIIKALDLGADDYVTKPLDDDFFLNKINHYLKHESIPPLPFYKVSESDAQCTIRWDDGIRSINEYGITLQSPHFISKRTLVQLTGDFIEEISGHSDGIKVSVNNSWIDKVNHLYQAQCQFNYEDETLLEHIRSYLLTYQE